MLWDTHMHTAFSTDSETSPESMIKASIELGLGGICITDHMDYDYPKEHPEDYLRHSGLLPNYPEAGTAIQR